MRTSRWRLWQKRRAETLGEDRGPFKAQFSTRSSPVLHRDENRIAKRRPDSLAVRCDRRRVLTLTFSNGVVGNGRDKPGAGRRKALQNNTNGKRTDSPEPRTVVRILSVP